MANDTSLYGGTVEVRPKLLGVPLDDRSFWINYVSSLSTPLAIPLVYPRMMAIHDLNSKETDRSLIPPAIPLSSEHVSDDGIYLLENGEDCLIYIGNSVDPDITRQLFGISSVDEIPTQFILEQYENPLSKKLNDVVNEIRRQRCSYLRLKLCKKGDSSGLRLACTLGLPGRLYCVTSLRSPLPCAVKRHRPLPLRVVLLRPRHYCVLATVVPCDQIHRRPSRVIHQASRHTICRLRLHATTMCCPLRALDSSTATSSYSLTDPHFTIFFPKTLAASA
ncbi:hypothetical protein U1Q18_027806 [Sarracenia purpurea var. burkii]